jgi:hypothetical protein
MTSIVHAKGDGGKRWIGIVKDHRPYLCLSHLRGQGTKSSRQSKSCACKQRIRQVLNIHEKLKDFYKWERYPRSWVSQPM